MHGNDDDLHAAKTEQDEMFDHRVVTSRIFLINILQQTNQVRNIQFCATTVAEATHSDDCWRPHEVSES